ncbi:MAG: hypothetical protein BWY85_00230 [Firmicutes bacterium ADurb.Bin506]|nr:MAG: hypothetical protein BWY85_00230 [Firmicutes bacterium ADurb.Bin506]
MKSIIKRWKSWMRKRKRRKTAKAKERANRKKLEFSKLLAIWAVSIATLSAAASYVLAGFYREAVGDVTTAIFTGCIGYLVTYAGKSLGEKMSRNKHHLDANGNPLPTQQAPGAAEGPDDEAPEMPSANGETDI